jgi:hypothetical protein
MKLRWTRLLNEVAAIDTGSADAGAVSSNDFSNTEEIGTRDDVALKDFGLDPAKYGLGKDEEKTNLETKVDDESSQGSDDTQEAGREADESAYLEWINTLGAIHNGQPLAVSSKDELKNLVQMGKDYTVKTQALSDERKTWETEKAGTETELNAAINEFNQVQSQFEPQLRELSQFKIALENLKNNAPDLFDEVQREYQNVGKHFDNPVLNQRLASMQAELAEVKKGLSSREDELILKNFENEKASMSATEQSMKELGVNVDWDGVKKQWASSGLPLKQVLGAMYFENVAKAQASKSKVDATKAKTAARPMASTGSNRSGQKTPKVENNGDYFAMAQQLYKQMRG